MSGTLSPVAVQTFVDANGVPYSGGLLYTYTSGTSTPATTYTDGALLVPNTNPIVLDSAGRCVIYLAASSYKYILKTSAGVTVWTADPVQSIGLITSGVYGVFDFAGDPNSPVTATSYPSGTTFDLCHAGTSWYVIDSANIASATYVLAGMLLGSGGTVTAALVNLTDGAPDTPLVTIASSSSTGVEVQSTAISFAAAESAKTYGIKTKMSAGTGFAWGLALVRTS